MKRTFTKYPNSYVRATKSKSVKYDTVGDLISALQKFPKDYPVKLVGQSGWGINADGEDICFIKNITEYNDVCEIELI